MTTTTAYRFGALDLLAGCAALAIILGVSALLQRAGISQPVAMAAGMAGGLLALYPAIRRWRRADVPLYKWCIVVAVIVVVSLSLQLLLLRI